MAIVGVYFISDYKKVEEVVEAWRRGRIEELYHGMSNVTE